MDDQIMMNDNIDDNARADSVVGDDPVSAATATLTIAPLDERVMVQELILAHLVKRQDLLSKQRQGMERKLFCLKTEAKNLLFKERTLELAQTQQIQLQSDVKAVMHKNRDKIRLVLMEHAQEEGDATNVAVVDSDALGEGVTIDEIMDVANKVLEVQQQIQIQQPLHDVSVEENNNSSEEATRSSRDAQADEKDQSDDGDESDETNICQEGVASLEEETPSNKQPPEEQVASPSSTFVSAAINDNPFTSGKAGIASLFSGINAQKNNQKQVYLNSTLCSTQLHLLVSGKRLEQMMELMVLDQAAMDHLYPEDGRHRRAALYYTCCCLMRPVWEQQLDNGAEIMITRVDRPATDEDDERTDSFTMDPNTSLCPYELAGECADPYCPFQHLKQRTVESQILILELLPLPVLSLVASLFEKGLERKTTNTELSPTSLEEEDMEEENLKMEVEGVYAEPESKRQKKLHRPSIGRERTTNQNEQEDGEGREALVAPLDFDDDFLSLPAADCDDSNDENEDDDSGEEQIPILWWMTRDDHERVRKRQLQQPLISVNDWLHTVFEVDVNADSTTLTDARALSPTPSGDDFIRRVGRLVDALQFVLHAGRYDYGSALCDMLAQIDDKRWRMVKTFFAATLPLQWTMLNRMQKKNVFSVALEQQLVLSLISEVFRFMAQRDGSTVRGKEAIISELLHRIVQLPLIVNRQSQGTAFLQKIKNDYPDLLPLAVAVVEMEMEWCVCEEDEMDEGKDSNLMSTLDDLQKIAQRCSGRMSTFQAIAKVGIFATAAVQEVMTGVSKDGDAQKNASRLESKLDNICSWIDEPFNQPHLRMMLTPILAVRVSLLIALQRYDRAQRTLERYLVGHGKLGVMAFADLLWSQLTMLRSNLPCRRHDVNTSPVESATTQLPQIIARLGVKLNHLSLIGDRNLFQPFLNCLPCRPSKQKIKKWRANLKAEILFFLSRATKLPTSEASSSSGAAVPDMKVDLHSMPMCVAKYPGKMLSLERLAFPRTFMLGGSCLKRLQLDGCRIEELPPTFGNYFPNLQQLAINNNRLTKLPSSFRNLVALVRLDASMNKLTVIPEQDGVGGWVNLEYLNVSHNQLTSLPNKDMWSCSKLIRLDLSYNQFQEMPNDLILHIGALVFLEMKGNPCCAAAAGTNKNNSKA